jgi:hypothetical protein
MHWQLMKHLAVMVAVFSLPNISWGWGDSDIVQVEEEWELRVLTTDPLQDAPQVSTWMSPTSDLDSVHFGFDLNHTRHSKEVGGGFQCKAMDGESMMDEKILSSSVKLEHSEEVVRWTQVMSVHGGRLYFSLKSGSSQSFGAFGGSETRVSAASPVASLNSYSHEASQSWAGVGFASNRVAHLKLVRVRKLDGQGNVTEVHLDHPDEPSPLTGNLE